MENKVFNVLGKNIQMRVALIDGENYIRLRDLEKVSMFKSPYDEKTKIPGLELALNDIAIEVDGEKKTVKAVNIDGYNFCKPRDIVKAFGNMKIDYTDKPVIIRQS